MATEDLIIRIATRGAESAAGSMGKVAKATAAVGAAVLAVGVKSAMDFQNVMAEVKAVTGSSATEMKTLSDAALKLGAESGMGASEAGKAIAELGKSGMDASTIIGGALPAAIALAQAGSMNLDAAASATANTMGLFGLKASSAGHIADALAMAANQTTADVSHFTMALAQGGSAANAAGLSFDETTAALMALADIGVKGSDAGTSLKSMLTQLASPTLESAHAMEKLGIDVFDAKGNFKPLAEVAGDLKKGFGGLTKEQRLSTATTIAGTDGQRALLALMEAGKTDIDKYTGALSKQGTAAQVAKDKNDTLAGAFRRVKATAEAAMIKNIMPWLDKLGAAINSFMLSLEDGEGRAGEFIRGVKSAAGWARKFGSTLITSVTPVVRDLSRWIGQLVQGFRDGQGAGGVLRTVIETLGGIALTAAGSIDNVWHAVKAIVEWIGKASPYLAGFAVFLAVVNAPAIAGAIAMGIYTAAMVAYGLAAGAAAIASGALAAVMTVLGSPILLIVGIIAGLVTAIVLLWKKNEGFRTWVKGAWEDIKSTIGGVARAIGGFFSGIPGTIKGVFTGVINFLIGGMNQVIGLMNSAIDAFNALPVGKDFDHIAEIGLMGAGPSNRGTVESDPSKYTNTTSLAGIQGLAQGGVVRGTGQWTTGENGLELNEKRPDGSVKVTPLGKAQAPAGGGQMVAVVHARPGQEGLAALLEMLVDHIEIKGAHA